MNLTELRKTYHQKICQNVIRTSVDRHQGNRYPNFADSGSKSSMDIAQGIVQRIGCIENQNAISGQTAGDLFEEYTKEFIEDAFNLLQHIRPGQWVYSTTHTDISGFEQYEHLAYLSSILRQDKHLSAALGGDYIVKPDIIVARRPMLDADINQNENILIENDPCAELTPLRLNNRQNAKPLLHGVISCKWTIRSDRSQNTRTEALNLIRNRKGPLPHIMAVTAEPLPMRIASLALGTGDLDCVYHMALPELEAAIRDINNQDQLETLLNMVDGRRLRDISDLPFDLAV